MEKQNVTKELLRKYFSGQCTKEEKETVRDFIDTHSDHEILSEFLERLWQETGQERVYSDPQKTLERYKKIRRQLKSTVQLRIPRYYRVAASLLLIATLSGLLYWFATPIYNTIHPVAYLTYITKAGERKKLLLPDGSEVWLNCLSSIQYPERFGKQTRVVRLKGEAFFSVRSNKEKPFIVHTGDLYIRVLGTSFNVKNYAGEDQIRVTVTEGKVAVGEVTDTLKNTTNQFSVLLANEQLTVDRDSKVCKQEKIASPGQFTGWTTGKLIFRKASLTEVALTLRRWFGVTVETGHQINNGITFTADFKPGISLEDVLETLSLTKNIYYEMKDGHVKITSPAKD